MVAQAHPRRDGVGKRQSSAGEARRSPGAPAVVAAAVADKGGLRAEAAAARRDGFSAKLAIDPAQPRIINEAFAASAGSGPRMIGFRRVENTNP